MNTSCVWASPHILHGISKDILVFCYNCKLEGQLCLFVINGQVQVMCTVNFNTD